MKCYVIPAAKGIDSLTLAERPDPTPGPRQVLVRVRATSLNYRDLLTIEAQYARSAPKPDLIPLSDGAGEVVAVGPGVSRVKVGDRVAGCFMQRWFGGAISESAMPSAMGGAIDGMLTELAVLEEEGVVKLPAHLSYEEGATLPCAAVTAWNALVEIGHIKAGDVVQIQGTGGVSIFALQLAKLAGAKVIITSSSDEKLARAKALGADHLINYRTTPDWAAEVLKLTDGLGADFSVDIGGPGTLNETLKAVRSGGRISLMGVLTGFNGPIDTVSILRKRITLQGIYVGSVAMLGALARTPIKPVIDQSFAFEDAEKAYATLVGAGHFGKLVIRIAQ